MRRRKAFSLLELLVTTGIISLLVTITLPALKKAKTYARVVECQTRQQALYKNIIIAHTEDEMKFIDFFSQSNIVRWAGDYHRDAYFGEEVYRLNLANCPTTRERETISPTGMVNIDDKTFLHNYFLFSNYPIGMDKIVFKNAYIPIGVGEYSGKFSPYELKPHNSSKVAIVNDELHDGKGFNTTYFGGHTKWRVTK